MFGIYSNQISDADLFGVHNCANANSDGLKMPDD
jgi:hypothetical protein